MLFAGALFRPNPFCCPSCSSWFDTVFCMREGEVCLQHTFPLETSRNLGWLPQAMVRGLPPPGALWRARALHAVQRPASCSRHTGLRTGYGEGVATPGAWWGTLFVHSISRPASYSRYTGLRTGYGGGCHPRGMVGNTFWAFARSSGLVLLQRSSLTGEVCLQHTFFLKTPRYLGWLPQAMVRGLPPRGVVETHFVRSIGRPASYSCNGLH